MNRPSFTKNILFCWGLVFSGMAVAAAQTSTHYEFRQPLSAAYRVDAADLQQFSAGRDRQWLKAWPESGSTNFVQLGSRVVLQLKSPADLPQLIAGHALKRARSIDANTFILQAPDALTAVREAHRLAALPQVSACYPVIRGTGGQHSPYAPMPAAGYFDWQYYLENRNPATGTRWGADINVRSAWPVTRGAGVTVAVCDAGFETNHPDLITAATGAPHYNFDQGNFNGAPEATTPACSHGTAVAGLIAAQSTNFLSITGVAPAAKMASWIMEDTNGYTVSDENLMDMYEYVSNTVAVQNHSWGEPDGAVTFFPETLLENIGISNAVAFGQGGRGVVIVHSCGNNRTIAGDANDDAHCSDPRAIAVASVRVGGQAADYSSAGASILVSAVGGQASDIAYEFTTDRQGALGFNLIQSLNYSNFWNYDYDFYGTSAAAPQVAGIAALLLSANPNLTYRDVQQILILSSQHFDFADPDLTTNGAGFLVSHNDGFGVPDAGVAVRLAQKWINRPANTNLTFTSTNVMTIPAAGLRVLTSGSNVPPGLASIPALPSTGPQADAPTAALPLVDFGYGTNLSGFNLTNKAALIERGASSFLTVITNAAHDGAAFAIVYNYPTNNAPSNTAPGGDFVLALGGTDFVPIPAVFIGNTAGAGLQSLFLTNPAALVQISRFSTSCVFTVTNTLLCEHIGLEVQSSFTVRGDLRITLVSPEGTRSVLQHYGSDTSAGPVDWTYYSTHHFFESSAGKWTAYFTDDGAAQGNGETGAVQSVTLKIEGVPITDTDHNGLADSWQLANFGNLNNQPAADPAHDGYSNMRNQIMGTSPTVAHPPLQLDLSQWNPSHYRLSWPGSTNYTYQIWGGTNPAALALLTNWPGYFPETEWFTASTNPPLDFFQVRSVPNF